MSAEDREDDVSSMEHPHGPRTTCSRSVRHELHSSVFAIDLAVGAMAAAQELSEREQLGRAVRRELERIQTLVSELDPPDRRSATEV